MNTIHTEFDRTLRKTHKSRYTKFTPSKTSGFTLIELLVVVSIIALLSTIVLAAVNDGRVKARNSAKNESMKQYINALELYRSNNANYPIFGNGSQPINTTHFACLGYAAGENCFGSISPVDGDTALNSSLSIYFSGNIVPKDTKSIPAGAWGDMKGVLYACRTNSDCSKYDLYWHLEGQSQKCGPGFVNSANYGGTTQCKYQN